MLDDLVVEAFRANGLEPPRATVYAADINARIRLAATGRFLAVLPAVNLRFLAKQDAIKMLPVEFPTSYRQIGLIVLKNRTLSPLAQLFIDCAREIANPIAGTRHGRAGHGRLPKVS
jgi:DNA-binding transcriptional LysR family regulator